jgi:hypothetical protein
MKWIELIGKKVHALRGHKMLKYGVEVVPLSHVLFDDGKTFLEFHEQDKYDFHDCCSSARTIDLLQDEERWGRMSREEDGYLHTDASDPF